MRHLGSLRNSRHPLLRLPRLLVHQRRSIHRHRHHIDFSRHGLPLLAQRRQQFEVVDVECRRAREEYAGLLIEGVAERVRRSDGHDHVVPSFGVDDFLIRAWVARLRDVEADGALGDEEGLVVHFVPVRWRAWGFGRHYELCDADAVVW